MDIHLDLREVTKRYARIVAVDRLSMAVPRGSVFGLLGPNGAGKTTTIRMVMRIAPPDEGEILLAGTPIDDAVRERIGYLPEERGLYRKMEVLEHLVFLGEIRGLERAEARRRAAVWLERVGLADKAKAKVEELSKGMQQKVQFAGSVLHEPELVILDEPFTGLDPIATRQLKDEILEMRGRGTTVLFSTHVLPQAEELCDRVCLINRGRVILSGTLPEVRTAYTRPGLRVVTAATEAEILAVPGVATVRPHNDAKLVELLPGVTGPEAIRALAAALPLQSVEPHVDSLEDIFLRAVEDDHVPLA